MTTNNTIRVAKPKMSDTLKKVATAELAKLKKMADRLELKQRQVRDKIDALTADIQVPDTTPGCGQSISWEPLIAVAKECGKLEAVKLYKLLTLENLMDSKRIVEEYLRDNNITLPAPRS